MQPGGKRWSSSVSPEPLGMHLGSLAGFLPCPISCWCLLRERSILFCFWDTWNAEKVKFLGRWPCKGRVGSQSFPERCYPRWNRHVLNLFAEQKPPVLRVLVGCDRPSHSGTVYTAFCQQQVCSSGFFSPPKSFKRVTSQKMQVQWKFYSPGLCNFYRASSSQADNPIFSCLWLCPSCLTWIWSWCLCMCWLLQMLLRTKKLGGCWRGKRPVAVG